MFTPVPDRQPEKADVRKRKLQRMRPVSNNPEVGASAQLKFVDWNPKRRRNRCKIGANFVETLPEADGYEKNRIEFKPDTVQFKPGTVQLEPDTVEQKPDTLKSSLTGEQ